MYNCYSIAKYELRPEARNELERLVRGKQRRELNKSELQRRVFALDSLVLEPPCTFTMRGYTGHKRRRDEWLSEPFYSHPQGYKMCLSVYANGNGKAEGSHVSVFVQLMWGEYDSSLTWPYRGNITLELLDTETGWSGHQKTISFLWAPMECAGRVENGEMNTGWGEHNFVEQSALTISTWHQFRPVTYLRNDCLHFRVNGVTH